MLKKSELLRTILLLATLTFALSGHDVYGDDYEPVKSLVDKYHQAGDDNKRKDIFKKLSQTEPKTQEDGENLRKVFQRKDWDEILFAGSSESIKKVKDRSLDTALIEILADEKPFIDRASRRDHGGKSDKEVNYRLRNVEFIIHKLGEFKSQNAVPILKEYLAIQGAALWASEALAKIGDKSASEEMRDKAYRGEEINYGGQGLDEAINVVKDLEDETKKDQWPKITKQLIQIRDPKAKPYLKKLFSHEKKAIREKSAMAYSNLVDASDVNDIIEMSKNSDWIVRVYAIQSMKHLTDDVFGDVLISLMLSDPHRAPRYSAAKALGYKKSQKATPSLEKALKDKDQFVRDEAYVALYIITGKKYIYEGRSSEIEQRAERERQTSIQ